MNGPLHLVADDLTGALDSAASFAMPGAPVAVSWSRRSPTESRPFAFSTETRDGSAEDAARETALAAAAMHGDCPLFFKKIDSLLRGHVAVELAIMARHLQPTRIVLAPAHPALGRVTRDGRQLARSADGRLAPTGVDLVAQLSALGVVNRTRALAGLVMTDAETEADLASIVAKECARGGRILWCGSGGLAQALAGERSPYLPVPAGAVLAIVGTDHPVARAQVDAVRGLEPEAVIDWSEADNPAALARRIQVRLAAGRPTLLASALTPRPRAEAAAAMTATLPPILHAIAAPEALFCSGGATLRLVCDALGAEGLDCVGFVADGIPLSRLVDGRWPRCVVVSKSGAFGDHSTLADLLLPATGNAASKRDLR